MVGSVRPAPHAPSPGRSQKHSASHRASEARWQSVTGPSPAREPIGEYMLGRFNKPIEWHWTRMATITDTQVSPWLDDYTEFLPQLLAMLKPGGVAFVTSLFTDCHVDARIQITEYEEDGSPRIPMFYNIYAWNRFRDYCLGLGAVEVTAEDFEMDI